MGSGSSAAYATQVKESSVEDLQAAFVDLEPQNLRKIQSAVEDTIRVDSETISTESRLILRCPKCKRTWQLPESGTRKDACCPVCYFVAGEEEKVYHSSTFVDIDVNHMFSGEKICTVTASPSTPVVEMKDQIAKITSFAIPQLRLIVDYLDVTDAAILPDAAFEAKSISFIVQDDPRWTQAKLAAAALDAAVANVEDGNAKTSDKIDECIRVLAALEDGAKLEADSIVRVLNNGNSLISRCIKPAAEALLAMGVEVARPHMSALLQRIEKHPEAVSDVIIKLGNAGVACASEVACYLEEDRDPEAACYILRGLGREQSAPFAGKIALSLKSREKNLRKQACELLCDLGAIAELSCALSSQHPEIRQLACEGILELGPDAVASAANDLAKLLKDKLPPVRSAACNALGRLPSPVGSEYAPVVAQFLNQELHHDVRIAAFQALVALGSAEQLATLLGHADPDIRGRACVSLASLGQAAVPQLCALEALQEDDASTNEAIVGFATVGEAAKEAVLQLEAGS